MPHTYKITNFVTNCFCVLFLVFFIIYFLFYFIYLFVSICLFIYLFIFFFFLGGGGGEAFYLVLQKVLWVVYLESPKIKDLIDPAYLLFIHPLAVYSNLLSVRYWQQLKYLNYKTTLMMIKKMLVFSKSIKNLVILVGLILLR